MSYAKTDYLVFQVCGIKIAESCIFFILFTVNLKNHYTPSYGEIDVNEFVVYCLCQKIRQTIVD